jgi:DNA end-binding protein Ku
MPRKSTIATVAGREWLVAIAPMRDGLVMEMVRYAEELRDPGDYFSEIVRAKPDPEMVDLALQLIEKTSGPFEPEHYQDHYRAALKELVRDKLKGRKLVAPHEEEGAGGTNVVDLMEALHKSVGQTGKGPAKPKAGRQKKRA